MQKSDKPAEYTKCTAYGFLDHSLKEDCATIIISLKGVSNGETRKRTIPVLLPPHKQPKSHSFFQNALRKGYFLKDITFRVNVSSEKQSH